MKYRVLSEVIPYTGKELRSGWIEAQSGLAGDAAIGFLGPCDVATEDLVDMEDQEAGETIRSEQMAHVIIEHPRSDLQVAVLRQRLLVCILCEILAELGHLSQRKGDDVYLGGRKLTVSIAAPSPGSCLIHLGINVRPGMAPVPAVGLEEMNVDSRALLSRLLERYCSELASCGQAETKVRGVP